MLEGMKNWSRGFDVNSGTCKLDFRIGFVSYF